MVELLDRPHQPDVAVLDQVGKRYVVAAVLRGDAHDEAQIRERDAPLRLLVALLNPLGKRDLLLAGQVAEPPYLLEPG